MKSLKIAIILVFLFSYLRPQCFAASEALEKVSLPQLYSYQIEDYAKTRFKFDLSKLKYSDDRINTEAALAGWNAFKDNCDLQGGAFTIGEECLAMSFLKGINSIQGEIGGAFVLLQLLIDLSEKEYGTAAFNLVEGSIMYAIGKWGTSTMKICGVAYTATKFTLIKVYKTFRKYHDEFYYTALRHYFINGGGKRNGKDWINDFKAFNNGAGVQSTEDVIKVVDNYISRLWDVDEFFAALGDVKDYTGGILERDITRTFEDNREHFVNYIKSVVIFPFLEPVLNKMLNDNIEKESRKIIDGFKALAKEFNREYTMKGVVRGGPQDKVSGLRVRIPGFLETSTNFVGQYQFKFTLYSLLKSRQPLVVELSIPTKDGGTRYLTKSGKLTDKHRQTGVINVKAFELSEKSETPAAIDMDARTFYGLYCKTALKLQPSMYSNMDRQTYEKMRESGQGVFSNEGQCVSYYSKLEDQAVANWRQQGEGPERIKQGVQALRGIFKMTLTRDGCKKFYGGFVGGLYGMSKASGETEAEREANFQRARNEIMRKVEGVCNQLPERLDW